MVLQVGKKKYFHRLFVGEENIFLPARAPYTPLACLREPRHDKGIYSVPDKKMNAYMHLLR